MKNKLNTISITNDFVCSDDNECVIVDAMLKNVSLTLPAPRKGKIVCVGVKIGLLKTVTLLSPSGIVHRGVISTAGTYTLVSDGIDWV